MANIPATIGKFGNHEYYAIRMKAKQVVERFLTPREVPKWESPSIEERWQRDINMNRVKNHIAPYLVQNENRFFGAFICIIDGAVDDFWVPFSEIADYKHEEMKKTLEFDLDSIGFVRILGDESIIPIDGQHRYAALQMAINGKDHKGAPLACGGNLDVNKDDCMVIIIKNDEPSRLRQIFNKVNRYAKPTSKTDNIITSDDDAFAICTRTVCSLLTDKLVKFTTTLSKSDFEFTTLPIIYRINEVILNYSFSDEKISTSQRPNDEQLELYIETCVSYWTKFIEGVDIWAEALKDPENKDNIGDDNRRNMRDVHLILKPIIQLVLFKAFFRLKIFRPGQSSAFSNQEIINRINEIDWTYANPIWKGVLFKENNKIIAKGDEALATRVISYHLGEKLSPEEIDALKFDFKANVERELEPPINS